MEAFTRLYAALDETTRTLPKVAALEAYFRNTPPGDAAWTLYFLTGRRIKRAVNTNDLRIAAAEAARLPVWLLDESYHAVGDLSETISLLLPPPASAEEMPLHRVVGDIILPMRRMDDAQRRAMLIAAWDRLPAHQRFVFHKLISGSFRVGVSRILAVRALSQVAGVSQGEMDHRVMGDWEPTPDVFASIIAGSHAGDAAARPYPFYLASQLNDRPETLGDRGQWFAEWKWDGIRAQLIRRQGRTLLWSRGEELVTDRYPEIERAASDLPDGTVLDGEILAWEPGADRPLPFAHLQTRIGRTRHRSEGEFLFVENPVVFLAYDLLELNGADLRAEPIEARRVQLEALIANAGPPILRLSPLVPEPSWDSLRALREGSRQRHVEGLMLKRRGSPYGVGRTRGDWWKWKIDPHTVDAVLIAAQPGTGKRATLYTDYTFGVWSGPSRGQGELVPVAKAYSGLTDAEIRRVDNFVRMNTLGRFGPVRTLKPRHVFELAFEGIQESTRHKAGVALRFPRMARWREDKKPEEADTLESLRALLRPPV